MLRRPNRFWKKRGLLKRFPSINDRLILRLDRKNGINSWKIYDAVDPLSVREWERVRREKIDRLIRSRYVKRDKIIGLTNE